MRDATSDARKFAAAEKAQNEGDYNVAGRIYSRLVISRTNRQLAETAKQRLTKLQDQGRAKLTQIDSALALKEPPPVFAASDAFDADDEAKSDSPGDRAEQNVLAAFQSYERLARAYASVPKVGPEIRTHVNRQRRRPEFAAVLNEREAVALLNTGRSHEAKNELCCAYLAYEEAAQLVPAPSANDALGRLQQLKEDPNVPASARACSDLKWCHAAYRRAEMLEKVKPDAARAVYAQIVERAPVGSQVHQAAASFLQ